MDHSCLLYDDSAAYRHRLHEFFADGIQRGLRVLYAGPGDVDTLRAELTGFPGLDELLATGALQIVPFGHFYGAAETVDPQSALATYVEATEQALADGFRGLRVSADVTELVRTQKQQDAFAQYEFLIGRYMRHHPLSGMCTYSRELGDDTVAQFAALHPDVSPEPTAFHVFASDDGAFGLRGDFDAYSSLGFARVLQRLRPQPTGDALVVDMSDVQFVDHRMLLTLNGYARANRITIQLRAAPPMVSRLMDLLPEGHLQLTGPGSRA